MTRRKVPGLRTRRLRLGVTRHSLTAFLALALTHGAEPVFIDGVIAYVNRHPITLGDVQLMTAHRQHALMARHKGLVPSSELKRLYEEGLNALIERYLILDAFADEATRMPEWPVELEIESAIRENFKGDRSALIAALSKDRLTFEEWRQQIRNHLLVALFRNRHVTQRAHVTPAQVEQYYAEHADRYRRPDRVRIGMIVLQKERSSYATDLENARQRLQKGEDFSLVARALSHDATAELGGDWGWIPLRDLRAELQTAIGSLQPGAVSDPVETPEETYLVKLHERQAEGIIPLSEVYEQIEQELRRQEAERLYKAWIEQLRSKAYVKIFERKD